MDRRELLGIAAGAAVLPALAAARTAPSEPDDVIHLWPNGAPGMPARPPVEAITERHTDPFLPDRSIDGIARPRLHVFRPARPNGAAVLITPGGGYKYVVLDREGHEIARWLTAQGFTAFVLLYRLPGDGWAAGPNVALADAQRAMRLIRSRAAEWKIDPARVGALGYSAGGHVCGSLAARHGEKVYTAVDAADALDAKPIVAAPLYPALAMDPFLNPAPGTAATTTASTWPMLDTQVTKAAPPMFLCHAEDDATLPVENTLRLRAACRAAGVPVETHLFAQGGHGFGLRFTVGKPVAAWPDLFLAWARTHGLLG